MSVESAAKILREAIEQFNPTHIVSMVSGGYDSAASDAVAEECGVKIDLRIHGNTRCGIQETSRFVERVYGNKSSDFAVADAGTAYEDYVLRKGFFGKGIAAHGYAYRVLKATPFRKTISANIRQGRRNVRTLLINGARQDESENRKKNLQVSRADPASKGDVWINPIHFWSEDVRNAYLESRGVELNPVAKALCRSGECMCGTMQSAAERVEASAIYPEWGNWIDNLEAEAVRLHGFGWGQSFPRVRKNSKQPDLFQPMCKDCTKGAQL